MYAMYLFLKNFTTNLRRKLFDAYSLDMTLNIKDGGVLNPPFISATHHWKCSRTHPHGGLHKLHYYRVLKTWTIIFSRD